MNIGIRNTGPEGKIIPNGAYRVVKENDTCTHWKCRGDESLSPMRECWYCMFSDFRKDLSEHLTHSVCRWQINQSEKLFEGKSITKSNNKKESP